MLLLNTDARPAASASGVTTAWRYRNSIIVDLYTTLHCTKIHIIRIGHTQPGRDNDVDLLSAVSCLADWECLSTTGIVMVFAWCVFANFGMLMPRYYKPTWNGKTCCGKAVWFQVGPANHYIPG